LPATSGHALAVPPTSVMNSRRLIDRIAPHTQRARGCTADIQFAIRYSKGFQSDRVIVSCTVHAASTKWAKPVCANVSVSRSSIALFAQINSLFREKIPCYLE
jgi:hypothetical protein